MRTVIVFLCALLFAGCAQVQTAHDFLHKVTRSDLDAALVIATKYQHRAGMQCYPVLIKAMEANKITVEVRGVVSAFELAHVKLNDYSTTLEQEIHLACAPLVIEAKKTIAGLMIKFGIAP